ncbi:hypothetical protein SAMN05444369_10488 [Capnocytophaga haemolytica]|nr:hypothetical protein [Capnocytophaga haemolytica]SFN89541.1 hypothetical protein SAMN05444369_10488 [Capnocytophaga haemolytica]SNV16638.1 Uncharacterised protein [Capnocytophaga haemolytica]
MTKIKGNAVMYGASGMFGKQVVFRKYRGELIAAIAPERSAKYSAAQKMQQEKFKEGCDYAKRAAKDSDLWLRYTERAKELKLSPHNLALADYLLPPKIDRVNTKSYDGRVGSKLFIIASDNFQITSVSVRINKDDGNLLEEGNAVLEGLQWVYPITVANAALSDTKLTVSVTDTPGNVTEKEIIL